MPENADTDAPNPDERKTYEEVLADPEHRVGRIDVEAKRAVERAARKERTLRGYYQHRLGAMVCPVRHRSREAAEKCFSGPTVFIETPCSVCGVLESDPGHGDVHYYKVN